MIDPSGARFVADRERMYSESELCDLLDRAAAIGLNMEKGSDLEKISIRELERLLKYVV